MRKRIGIDLDNTLCEGKHWNTPEEVLEAKPIPEMVELVNKFWKDDFVIIYTARQNFLMSATFDWLDKHNIKYHAVSNRKIPLDAVFDDTAFQPKRMKTWKDENEK